MSAGAAPERGQVQSVVKVRFSASFEMNNKRSISIEGCPLTVVAERRDRPWGHAIEVEVVGAGDAILGKIGFACHPEFGDFDAFQAMPTEALIEVVQRRLNPVAIAEACSAFERGITTLFLLNSPDEPRGSGSAGGAAV